MTNKVPILITIGLLLLIGWMYISNEKTAGAFDIQKAFVEQRIAALDSTVSFLRVQETDVQKRIVEQDSLIAKLKFRGWRLRVQLKNALNDVELANQIITYNETDSALVGLLRSVYSDRIRSRN